jgi:hypothetical protein
MAFTSISVLVSLLASSMIQPGSTLALEPRANNPRNIMMFDCTKVYTAQSGKNKGKTFTLENLCISQCFGEYGFPCNVEPVLSKRLMNFPGSYCAGNGESLVW